MALRIFLVGLVASLALDLPSRGRVRTQWEEGQTWVAARVTTPVAALARNEPDPTDAPAPALAVAKIEPVATIAPEPVAPESFAPASSSTPALAALADLPPAAPVVEPMPMPMPAPAPEIADSLPTPVEVAVPAPAIAATEVPATPEPEVAPPLTTSTPEVAVIEALSTPEADPDDAFRAVVGSMASAFAADASAMPRPEPSPTAEPLPLLADDIAPPPADEPAPLPIADEADVFSGPTGLAYALNREAEGLGPIEAPVVPEVARNETMPDGGDEWPDASSRADRLEQAVKLTGQAVQAWASLLIQRPAVVSIQR